MFYPLELMRQWDVGDQLSIENETKNPLGALPVEYIFFFLDTQKPRYIIVTFLSLYFGKMSVLWSRTLKELLLSSILDVC